MSLLGNCEKLKKQGEALDWDRNAKAGFVDDLRNRNKRMSQVNHFGLQIASSLLSSEKMPYIYEQIRRVVGSELVIINLLEGDTLIPLTDKENNNALQSWKTEEINVGQGFCGHSARIQKAIYSLDIHKDDRCTLNDCKKIRVHSLAAIPLIAENNLIGVLGLASKKPRHFEDEVDYLEALATNIAAGIRNKIMYEQQLNQISQLRQKLKERSQDLEKANRALADLTNHRQVEKKAIEQDLYAKLKRLVLPYVQQLEVCKSDRERQVYLEMIKTNLKNLMPLTSDTIFAKYVNFTPTEVKIADLIRQGKRTKEISKMLEMTLGSIFWYRNNIRKKLGLSHKKANLRNYLNSLIP